jgi:hypothetical protein
MIIAADDDKGESYGTAEINAGLTDEASYRISIPKYWRVPDPEESSGKMQRLVDLSTQSRSHSFWERQQIFVELLKMMDEGQKETISSPAWIVAEKTEAYIKRNYRGEVTNQTLSELLHCHPNYIARCMKEVYQCTPYFSRCFREKYTVTPLHFRKRYAK